MRTCWSDVSVHAYVYTDEMELALPPLPTHTHGEAPLHRLLRHTDTQTHTHERARSKVPSAMYHSTVSGTDAAVAPLHRHHRSLASP